jgi:Cu(I)/Ag(I) efflux system membrane fusion protein/cobalt-zinc-cadmium efflux system membrane fusion protein
MMGRVGGTYLMLAAMVFAVVLAGCGGSGDYTCPMHPEVRLGKDDLCPYCNMKLVPVESLETEPAASSGTGDAAGSLYTCGMHPQVVQEGPGQCPICGMDLTPMKGNAAAADRAAPSGECTAENALYWVAPMDPSYISEQPGKSPMGMDLVPVCEQGSASGLIAVDPVVRQNMGVRTALVRRGRLERTVRTVARVVADERKLAVVTTKFPGWIETLHVQETGQSVRAGQPLFEIYSPEVVAGQEEYLLAVRQGSRRLAESARNRLLLWDFTAEQVGALDRRGEPSKVMTVFAPHSGFVLHKNALQGAYVMPGEPLYRIVDLSTIWVMADIYEYEVPWVEVGQQAELELAYIPERRFKGTVSYIYPYLDEASRTVRVRLEFPNPDLSLKPGMFGTMRIRSRRHQDAVLVPSEAVLRTGERSLVFLDLGQGRFRPAELELGVSGDGGLVEVRSGLHPGQRVVTSGQFLLDSESQLREAVAKMLEARGQAAAGGKAAPETSGHQH